MGKLQVVFSLWQTRIVANTSGVQRTPGRPRFMVKLQSVLSSWQQNTWASVSLVQRTPGPRALAPSEEIQRHVY